MGILRFVFDMKDSSIREKIESLGWLHPERNSLDETGIEGVVTRNFHGMGVPSFLEAFFVATNYRAKYGVFGQDGRIPTGNVFGPATVLCYGLNSGDLSKAEETMKRGIRLLEDNIGEIKRGLTYEGLYFADDRLLMKDEWRSTAEKVLL